VPPRSIRERLTELGLAGRYTFQEVQACRECNCALGAKAIFALDDRKRYVKAWLRKRYQRYLKIPQWSDGELREIGHTLREHVLSGVLIAELVRARLKW
jgi:hypothetical protein